MKKNKCLVRAGITVALLAPLIFWSGCSRPEQGGESGHQGHFHAAPHGGSLVMLGDHMAQLELAPGSQEGEWIFYVLDGGAERFVRIEQESIKAILDGRETVFRATANVATGESVGDTAQFTAKVDGLTSESRFSVRIDEIVVYRQPFKGVEFDFPEGKH